MNGKLWHISTVSLSFVLFVACIGAGGPNSADTEAVQEFAQKFHAAFKPGLDEALGSKAQLQKVEVKSASKAEITIELGIRRPAGSLVKTSLTQTLSSMGGTVTSSFSFGGNRPTDTGEGLRKLSGGAVVAFDPIQFEGFSAGRTIEQPSEGTILIFLADFSKTD